jgi:hypothetical protein
VDDEPVGSTDPESGRLVKAGLAAGRHRVRVARAGHEDAVREIEVAAGGSVTFYATLRPVSSPPRAGRAGVLAFAFVALALVAVVAWMALRRPAHGPAIWAPTPRPPSAGDGGPALATPPGLLSPGARRDERGEEWFGDYRLLELLGRGAMASVYKASRRNELLALKRPLGSLLDDPGFLERFLREAEISRALNHPNIVRILERGFLGTPDYVAPETIERGVTEPRSDLYALGAVFYELLTGQRPFTGDTAFAILQKYCREEPRPPSLLDPRVPAELEGLVMRLLRKSPGERPASAEELVVALRDWLNRAA